MKAAFSRLMASEWRKVLTTKMLWGLILVALAFCSVNVITLTLIGGGIIPGVPGAESGTMLMNPDYLTSLLAQVSSAAIFVLVLGVIAMTGEFRHMTITSTFLSTPRRGRVLATKMVLFGVLGVVIAVIAMAAVVVLLLMAVTVLSLDHAPLTMGAIASVFVGALIGFALYAILGVSLGALIKNQVAAIILALVWVLLIEAIVGLALPAVSKWLPGGALSSAMDVGVRTDATGGLTQADRLPPWGGVLVLLAYAVVFAVIASRTTLRRDIT